MNIDSNNHLITLIRAYITEIRKYVSFLEREFHSNDLRKDLKDKKIPRTGTILQDVEFQFHGIGCRFELPNGKTVDFDFGYDARTDGFSIGWLKNFLETNCQNEFPYYLNYALLEKDFKELEECGAIIRSKFQHDHLYYLSEKNTK